MRQGSWPFLDNQHEKQMNIQGKAQIIRKLKRNKVTITKFFFTQNGKEIKTKKENKKLNSYHKKEIVFM